MPAPTGINLLTLGYAFSSGIWIAASTRQSLGGAVTIDGGQSSDPETNNRLGLTFSMPVMSRYALKLIATIGVTATVGNAKAKLKLQNI